MIIEKSHHEYLFIQRGEVSDHREFKAWKAAYEKSLADIFRSIHPVLPKQCGSILDIGSGLGGIDILLHKFYRCEPKVFLLDGMDCKPYVHNHHIPFSNAKVALDFHEKNGCHKTTCCYPDLATHKEPVDLIVSFAAYGFHIMPLEYMNLVNRHRHEDTVIILEVRRNRRDWLKQFVTEFGKPVVLEQREKFVRLAFGCKQ